MVEATRKSLWMVKDVAPALPVSAFTAILYFKFKVTNYTTGYSTAA